MKAASQPALKHADERRDQRLHSTPVTWTDSSAISCSARRPFSRRLTGSIVESPLQRRPRTKGQSAKRILERTAVLGKWRFSDYQINW